MRTTGTLLAIVLATLACSGGYPASHRPAPAAEGGAGGDAGGGGGGGAGGSEPDPCRERDRETCESSPGCRFIEPGCGEPAPPRTGCFDDRPCRDADCPDGEACGVVIVNPCGPPAPGGGCGACGAEAIVCVPRPVPCDWHDVTCGMEPPACPLGQVREVESGCWGSCVAPAACGPLAEEALCWTTGGVWEEQSCGHTVCGESEPCFDPFPGCACGFDQVFDPEIGCADGGCNPDIRLCERTGGVWEDSSCGHWICGRRPDCKAFKPGCDCGAGRIFEDPGGCRMNDICTAGKGEACGGDTGMVCPDELVCSVDGPGAPGVCRR